MEYFGWILALVSIALFGLIYAYSTGWFRRLLGLSKKRGRVRREPALHELTEDIAAATEHDSPDPTDGPAKPEKKAPVLQADSKVVAIRLVPNPGESLAAEHLILQLRAAGFRHGEFDIFHNLDSSGGDRIRYSVASLIEPGSFDLSKLKDSTYPGITMFMVLPAPEDGLALFDEMMAAARKLAKELDGRLIDEQGSLLSVQRERYMREEVIEFLRQQLRMGNANDKFEFGEP